MDTETIRLIAEIALLVLTGFFGKQWKAAKTEAKKDVAIAKGKTDQVFSVANKIIMAAEDDHITPEEVQEIAIGLKDFLPEKEE